VRFARLLLIVIVGVYLFAAVLYAIPVASGAFDDSMEVKFDRPDPSIVADYSNGLSLQQRESYSSPIPARASPSSRTFRASACCRTPGATTDCLSA
jgi:hypothetical protein